tara:strand:- start:3188 stop:3565 length:378 start_codon:yes stop_codon:yes gene_type:complete
MKIVKSTKAPKALGPYSQAIKNGSYVFTSGQIGISSQTGEIVSDNFELQATQAFKNLEFILIDSGSSLSKIIKLNIYLIDLNNFQRLNDFMLTILDRDFLPARATVEVSRLPKDAKIEIDAIAGL